MKGVIFLSFDGIILNNLKHELESTILDARIEKIYQPEEDELTISLRSSNSNLKLLLSSNAKYPRIHLSDSNKTNPMTAPLFCMILRKHLTGGRIIKFNQPNFERILEVYIEVIDEFRDLVIRKLIIEIMGKHSNIILTDENNLIIDSIKHISENISSVRTILPRTTYVYPPNHGKINPIIVTKDGFLSAFTKAVSNETIERFLYGVFTGISPLIANEICIASDLSKDTPIANLSPINLDDLYKSFEKIITQILSKNFTGFIIYDNQKQPMDFYSLTLTSINEKNKVYFKSLSETLDTYYHQKDNSDRIKQKYSDIKKLIENYLDRAKKKKVILVKSIDDTKNADEYKLIGDLIISYIYMIEQGSKEIEVINFFSEQQEKIKITLDKDLSPSKNAQRFFARYNKMNRTKIAATTQLCEVNNEIIYLQSLMASLDSVENEHDISEIKQELRDEGYLKKSKEKSKKIKSEPLHYISTDCFDIYVGKNNYQNDYLTMKFAKSNDLWLHTKEIPGSHVIIRADNKTIPDTTIYEAALLAAYYSKGRQGGNVPVDYTEKRNVKKPSGAKPGFVIYLTNKTMYVTPDEDEVGKIKENHKL